MPQFAVIRHADRADQNWCVADSWLQREDLREWPHDPPLSDHGFIEARAAADEIMRCDTTEDDPGAPHMVVSSPYMRCWQTAVEICLKRPSAVLLIDYSLGEIYGPDIFGDAEPVQHLRPVGELKAYCRSHGVKIRQDAVGLMPTWPEFEAQARTRILERFLQYLRRSQVASRNFTLVMHSHGVKVALQAMPAMQCRQVEKVQTTGFFTAILPAVHQNMPLTNKTLHADQAEDGCLHSDEDVVGDGGQCFRVDIGWQVYVSSNVQLGPRVEIESSKRFMRMSRQTSFSLNAIKRLLRSSLEQSGRSDPTSPVSDRVPSDPLSPLSPPATLSRLVSSRTDSDESIISSSTFAFGQSELASPKGLESFPSTPSPSLSPHQRKRQMRREALARDSLVWQLSPAGSPIKVCPSPGLSVCQSLDSSACPSPGLSVAQSESSPNPLAVPDSKGLTNANPECQYTNLRNFTLQLGSSSLMRRRKTMPHIMLGA